MIISIIRPEKLENVKEALEKKGFSGMTITEVKGRGVQKGVVFEWRAGEYKVDFLPKIKIEIVAKDKDVEEIINTIVESAHTGEIGDGKIFVSEISEVVRIRTKEKGENVL